jgi:hypothetical protein
MGTRTYGKPPTDIVVPQYDECVSCGGGCVEMWWDSSTIKYDLFVWQLKIKNTEYTYSKFIFRQALVKVKIPRTGQLQAVSVAGGLGSQISRQ